MLHRQAKAEDVNPLLNLNCALVVERKKVADSLSGGASIEYQVVYENGKASDPEQQQIKTKDSWVRLSDVASWPLPGSVRGSEATDILLLVRKGSTLVDGEFDKDENECSILTPQVEAVHGSVQTKPPLHFRIDKHGKLLGNILLPVSAVNSSSKAFVLTIKTPSFKLGGTTYENGLVLEAAPTSMPVYIGGVIPPAPGTPGVRRPRTGATVFTKVRVLRDISEIPGISSGMAGRNGTFILDGGWFRGHQSMGTEEGFSVETSRRQGRPSEDKLTIQSLP